MDWEREYSGIDFTLGFCLGTCCERLSNAISIENYAASLSYDIAKIAESA